MDIQTLILTMWLVTICIYVINKFIDSPISNMLNINMQHYNPNRMIIISLFPLIYLYIVKPFVNIDIEPLYYMILTYESIIYIFLSFKPDTIRPIIDPFLLIFVCLIFSRDIKLIVYSLLFAYICIIVTLHLFVESNKDVIKNITNIQRAELLNSLLKFCFKNYYENQIREAKTIKSYFEYYSEKFRDFTMRMRNHIIRKNIQFKERYLKVISPIVAGPILALSMTLIFVLIKQGKKLKNISISDIVNAVSTKQPDNKDIFVSGPIREKLGITEDNDLLEFYNFIIDFCPSFFSRIVTLCYLGTPESHRMYIVNFAKENDLIITHKNRISAIKVLLSLDDDLEMIINVLYYKNFSAYISDSEKSKILYDNVNKICLEFQELLSDSTDDPNIKLKLNALVIEAETYLRDYKLINGTEVSPYMLNLLDRKISTLANQKAKAVMKQNVSKSTEAGVGILIYGPPGTGKSYLINFVATIVQYEYKLQNIPLDDLKYNLSNGLKHMDAYENFNKIIVIDDLGNDRIKENPIYVQILTWLSSPVQKANMADVVDKGTKIVDPIAVIATTNVPLGNAQSHLMDSNAFGRRFFEIEPVPDGKYCTNGALDSNKIPPNLPQDKIISVIVRKFKEGAYKALDDNEIAYYADMSIEEVKSIPRIGKVNHAMSIVRNDNRRRRTQDLEQHKSIDNVEYGLPLHIAEKIIRKMVVLHRDGQVNYNNIVNNMKPCTVCEHIICNCNFQTMGEEYFYHHLFNNSDVDFKYIKIGLLMFLPAFTLYLANYYLSGDDMQSWKRMDNHDDIVSEQERLDTEFHRGKIENGGWKYIHTPSNIHLYKNHVGININDLLNLAWKRTLSLRFYPVGSQSVTSVTAIHIATNFYLCNKHTVKDLKGIIDVGVVDTPNIDDGINRSNFIKINAKNDIVMHPQGDLALICIPTLPIKSIIDKFPKVPLVQGVLFSGVIGFNKLSSKRELTRQKCSISQIKIVHKEDIPEPINKLVKNGEFFVDRSIIYGMKDCDTPIERGFCGSPLIVSLNDSKNYSAIAGIFSLSSNMKFLGFTPVDQKMIYDMIMKYNEIQSKSKRSDVIVTSSFLNNVEVYGLKPENDLAPELHLNSSLRGMRGTGCILGTLKDKAFKLKNKTNVKPSILRDDILKVKLVENKEYYGPILYPQSYAGKFEDPYRYNLDFTLNRHDTFNPEILDMCYLDYRSSFQGVSFQKRPILSIFESVNGIIGDPYITPLNMNTGSGFGKTGKKKEFATLGSINNNLQYSLNSEIILECSGFRRQLEKYSNIIPIVEANLKDEPVKRSKVTTPRLFGCYPMVMNIVFRQYLLPIIATLQSMPYISESCVGVNAFSNDWTRLYKYLTQDGKLDDKIIAGDFSKFDKQISKRFYIYFAHFMAFIAKKIGYSMSERQIVYNIINMLSAVILSIQGDLLHTLHGNVSGSIITVTINCFVNSMYMRYVYFKIMLNYSKKPIREIHFKDDVRLMTYGDDNIMSSSNPLITHSQIQKILQENGIKYTLPDKSDGTVNYMSIDKADFLKRRFVFNKELNKYMAPLDRGSLSKMLLYTNLLAEQHLYEALYGSFQSFLKELAQIDSAEFTKKRKLIQDIISNCSDEKFRLYCDNMHLLEYSECIDIN